MEKSLFIQYVKKIWPKLSLFVKEKENSGQPRTYLHKELLTKVYSPDKKWEGTTANTTYVAADVVAMDSPLPIKTRESMGSVGGKIPKVGMKKVLMESDIDAINIMEANMNAASGVAAGDMKKRIFEKFLNDGNACSVGIDETNEDNFLTGLYYGVILVEDEDNTGTGIRVNYGYMDSHTFGTKELGALSREDFDNVFNAAEIEGNTITTIAISKARYDATRKSRWARELVADYKEQFYTADSSLPVPSHDVFDAAFESEFGATFLVINRTVVHEKNGKRTPRKPFGNDRVIFLPDGSNLGSLVWGTLAEATRPVAGVEYTTVDEYKLISKYSKNDPLQEFTTGQAIVLPVIENVDQIYVLDLTLTAEVNDTEENKDASDQFITIGTTTYVKASAIAVLKQFGVNVRANASDAVVLEAYNTLSTEKKVEFAEKVTKKS